MGHLDEFGQIKIKNSIEKTLQKTQLMISLNEILDFEDYKILTDEIILIFISINTSKYSRKDIENVLKVEINEFLLDCNTEVDESILKGFVVALLRVYEKSIKSL